MIVKVTTLRVRPEGLAAFRAANIAKHVGAIEEPGVLRFDVLQSHSNPYEFLFYEVYETEQASLVHKSTPHYYRWRIEIEPLLAEPRSGAAYSVVMPAPDYR